MIDFSVQHLNIVLVFYVIKEFVSLVNSLHGFFDVALKPMCGVNRTNIIEVLLKFFSTILLTNDVIILAKNLRKIVSIHQRKTFVMIDESVFGLHSFMFVLES